MGSFSKGLSNEEAAEARAWEAAGVTSYSQAVKAFTTPGREYMIREFRQKYTEKQAVKSVEAQIRND